MGPVGILRLLLFSVYYANPITTEVQKPLAAASKIAAKGNRIVLEALGTYSYIENKQSGKRIPLAIENGVLMEMLVVPFQGPTKA